MKIKDVKIEKEHCSFIVEIVYNPLIRPDERVSMVRKTINDYFSNLDDNIYILSDFEMAQRHSPEFTELLIRAKCRVKSKDEIARFRNEFPFMQKMRTGGYDGRGVTPLRNDKDLNKAFDAPSLLEKFVDFDKEISVIVARNESGEVKSYPVVELEFNPEVNLVDFLFAPANLGAGIEQKAREIAEDLVEKTGIVGLLAVEMFVTKTGDVLVNEIAPRTHNSGHQSIEGNVTSQFEQHLRSVLNLPLGDTRMIEPSVMVNLLGEKGHDGEAIYEGMEEVLKLSGVHVHLYGKKLTRSFRKMGHVTVGAETLEEAHQIAVQVKEILKVKA